MAEEEGDNNASIEEAAKCPECEPGLPGWMATFSDLVTLLLTFFVLLLSFAKIESAKYEAALGSIRNAFGGNVFRQGEVIQKGKSPDDNPTMLESQQPILPFPIDFLTMEGILDKHEINRESDEDLKLVKDDLNDFRLLENSDIYELAEGIRVEIKDKIYFKKGSTVPVKINIKIYDRLVKMLASKKWTVYVMGYASKGETGQNGRDAFSLSAARSEMVARSLVKRGVLPERITALFYGDSKAASNQDRVQNQRRVEFMIRKHDVSQGGRKLGPSPPGNR